ncbi:MAG: DHHW family protein [Clostridiaceae bacterium]
MKKKRNIIYILLFISVISLNGLAILFKDDKKISTYENRDLASMPKVNYNSILKGDYFQKVNSYISDQVYKKEFWQKQYVNLNLEVLNKNKINQYVVTDNNFILNYNSYAAEDFYQLKLSVERSITSIKAAEKIVNENGGKLYFITIPTQSSMFLDHYPEYYNNFKEHYDYQRELISEESKKNNLNHIDMYGTLSKLNPEDVYFTSEHHYNFLGAYNTYSELINSLKNDNDLKFDRNVRSYDDFNVVEKDFKGAYNRQLMYLINNKDKLLLPSIDTKQWDITENKKKVTEIINTKSTFYSAFMNGEMSEAIMKTNKPQFDNALIIGDSFTNPLEPLLAMHFNETRSLDFRMKEVKVDFKKYIEEYKPKAVFVVVNEQSVRQENQNIRMKQ